MLHIYKLDTQLQYEYQSRQKVKKQVRINLVVCSQILFKTLCWYFHLLQRVDISNEAELCFEDTMKD